MKIIKFIMILGIFGFNLTSCEKDDAALEEYTETEEEAKTDTEEAESDLEVANFVYSGMNELYLYKADIPELADSYFSSDSEKEGFLLNFNSPEEVFEKLKYGDDRFSFITEDYNALEDRFNGISGTTGIKYGLGRINGTNNVFGYLQYILPGTSAEEEGLERGTVFTEINGKKLTSNNYKQLIESQSFTINIGKIRDGRLEMTTETVTLTDWEYTANPVYISKTLEIEGKKVGYLMYNSFIANFDDELNSAFADFKADGVQDLVLDLRYNGGGSVESAKDLAGMITGQFEGEVFMQEKWNEKYQEYYEANDPDRLINRFDKKIRTGESINSLNLSKVYVIATGQTASASELIINGLKPYIDVVQVGENTTGKFQASVTLYDSPNFARKNANENHTYALQPLVFKSANAAGKSDYVDGLAPDVKFSEDVSNLGTLGEPSEPLLKAALNHLLGKAQEKKSAASIDAERKFSKIGESGMHEADFQRMYIEEMPAFPEEIF